MRRLAIFVVFLVVLALVADFGARFLVQNLAARALGSRRGVNGDVSVSFGGFPFLLRLKDRHFTSVTVSAEDVRSGGFVTTGVGAASEARLDEVRLEMHDVRVDGSLWGDDADRVVVARSGGGEASIGSVALNRMVPEEYPVRLKLRDRAVTVSADTPAGPQEVEVSQDQVTIDPDQGTLVIQAPPPVNGVLIPLPELLPGTRFDSVSVHRGGLTVTFSLSDVRVEL